MWTAFTSPTTSSPSSGSPVVIGGLRNADAGASTTTATASGSTSISRSIGSSVDCRTTPSRYRSGKNVRKVRGHQELSPSDEGGSEHMPVVRVRKFERGDDGVVAGDGASGTATPIRWRVHRKCDG